MTRLRYRAFISYCHRDEAWAKWLHRGLETYRVPRKLVGKQTSVGVVPARIRPVFRDKDDLSSATDLNESVKQILADSENLIVICSPQAAASRWVGEEIHQFAKLGRVDKIFCIIVDGEPAADGSVDACFPPALAEIGLNEPLAADVRKWADGKHVAKVKLIAGLLGLRLDELRQRDSQRRHKRYAMVGLGVVAALVLAVMTVLSQIAERNEREKAEQLATFIVDLGERLQSDTDLETLALISSESFKHLKGIDSNKLSVDTGVKVGLVLRQMGRVSQFQGRPEEAREAFVQSRDLLASLTIRHPDELNILFELGNAEYYIGNLYFQMGQFDNAVERMQKYHVITQELFDSEPINPDWMLELSYSHNNLAALWIEEGKGLNEETLFHVAEATRLMEEVVVLRPDSKAITDTYATILAWAADAQVGACNLEEATELRLRSRDLARSAMQGDPGNNELRKLYSYAISGVASIQVLTGKLDLAIENMQQALSILENLFATDPSNVDYKQNVDYRRYILAELLGETGELLKAGSMMSELESVAESPSVIAAKSNAMQKDRIDFLLAHADIERRLGDFESAKIKLAAAIELLPDSTAIKTGDIDDIHRNIMARYQWSELNPTETPDIFPGLPDDGQVMNSDFRSCMAADSAARMYVLSGDKVRAAEEIVYLKSRGYAEPKFIRFCKDHDLCDG